MRAYRKNTHAIAVLLLAAVCLIAFFNTLKNPFMWDGKDFIENNIHIRSLKNIPSFFTVKYWSQLYSKAGLDIKEGRIDYRPVSMATFALDYLFWKKNPAGYHISNTIFHILNVILIYFLINRISDDRRSLFGSPLVFNLSFLSALLFAVHPIHTESITWIKNRSDALVLMFFLSSFMLFIKYTVKRNNRLYYISSLVFFAMAVLSKAMAVVLPLVLITYILYFLPRKEQAHAIMMTLPFMAVSCLYILFKTIAFGHLALRGAVSEISLYAHILVVIKTVGYYLGLLAFPVNLNVERLFVIPGKFFEPDVVLSALSLAACAVFAIKAFRHKRLLSFAVLWVLLTLIPVSNVILLTGRLIAEQRLYIPSAGFCILLAIGIRELGFLDMKFISADKQKNLIVSLLAVILISYTAVTIRRNLDWRDSVVFWSKTAEASPLNPRAHNNLGMAYSEIGKEEEAILSFEKAIELSPDYPMAYANLGAAYNKLKRFQDAAASFNLAISMAPHYANAYNNLGNSYIGMDMMDEAVASFRRSLELYPDNEAAYNNLGKAYSSLGKDLNAIGAYQKAIELNPYYETAYYNLGTAYYNLKRYDDSIAAYKKAIELKPDYARAYVNLGGVYNIIGRYEDAIRSYERAVDIDQFYAAAYNNLAALYFKEGRYELAIEYCDMAKKFGIVNQSLLNDLKPYRKQES